jgi:hypothetical protein
MGACEVRAGPCRVSNFRRIACPAVAVHVWRAWRLSRPTARHSRARRSNAHTTCPRPPDESEGPLVTAHMPTVKPSS